MDVDRPSSEVEVPSLTGTDQSVDPRNKVLVPGNPWVSIAGISHAVNSHMSGIDISTPPQPRRLRRFVQDTLPDLHKVMVENGIVTEDDLHLLAQVHQSTRMEILLNDIRLPMVRAWTLSLSIVAYYEPLYLHDDAPRPGHARQEGRVLLGLHSPADLADGLLDFCDRAGVMKRYKGLLEDRGVKNVWDLEDLLAAPDGLVKQILVDVCKMSLLHCKIYLSVAKELVPRFL